MKRPLAPVAPIFTGYVVAIDPGEDYAVALGHEGKLAAAWFQPVMFPDISGFRPGVVVVEHPKVYDGGAPTTSVVTLTASAYDLAGAVSPARDVPIATVPTVNLPKGVIEQRVRKVLGDCDCSGDVRIYCELCVFESALELVKPSKRNNVVDAVRHLFVYYERLRA